MPNPAEQKGQQRQNDDLGGKTLGRRHPDLRAGMHIDAPIALTGNGAADTIANSQRPISFAFALAQRSQSIDRLAALTDSEDQGVLGHRYVPVPKLACKLHFGRYVSKILEQAFADPAGVKREFNITDRYVPVMLLTVGYPAPGNWPRKPRLGVEDVLAFNRGREF